MTLPDRFLVSTIGAARRFLLLPLLCSFIAQAGVQSPPLRGNLRAHDPSTIIKCKDRYYMFSTGRGILSKSSADRVFWTGGPSVFSSAPVWAARDVPGFGDVYWAPDVISTNGLYYLYYSVSTFGSQVSGIGLATNPTLDPSDPAYHWTDQGPVIESAVGSAYNTIDPSVAFDAQGRMWMSFGSYWNGIYVMQLDPATGKRISPNSPLFRVAYNSSIEASCIFQHGGYYYLFVNWGSCCSGVNSTYNIRVGRSPGMAGPYLDRDGVNLANNGGTLFMEGSGKFVGPGHAAILREGDDTWLSYHYYDADLWSGGYRRFGEARFNIVPLRWTSDGWPIAVQNDWSAIYNFDLEARDARGQYSGLLMANAAMGRDPSVGSVLHLTGSNSWVQLPPGIAYARTFAAVVKWNGGAPWQRIFDFGTDTSRYVMLTPSSGDGKLRCDIKAGAGVQTVEAAQPLPSNIWTHVALTLDGRRGILYLNGNAVATNTITLSPVDVQAQTNALGRSKFAADPDFTGQIASFRVYGRALSQAELRAPTAVITSPVAGEGYVEGKPVSFSGTVTDYMRRPVDPTNWTWTVQFQSGTSTNVVFGPVKGLTEGSFSAVLPQLDATNGYFRIMLRAEDAGLSGTDYIDLFQSSKAGTNRVSSFYPFDRDASDASNRFDGVLVGGASVQIDPEHGDVLNLSGAGQYVLLPPGVADLRTISGWVKWNNGPAWQRIFDFGQDTQRYFFLTPFNGGSRLQCALTAEASSYVYTLDAPSLAPGDWAHLAVVLNGREGIMYQGGHAVAVNNSLNLLPLDIGATSNYFGKSQFAADPYFNGKLDSFLLESDLDYDAAVPRPELSIRREATNAVVRWPRWARSLVLLSTTNLQRPVQWTPVTNIATSTGPDIEVPVPATDTARFFRLGPAM